MDGYGRWVGRYMEINVRYTRIFKALLGNFVSNSKQNSDEGSENVAVLACITSVWLAYYLLIGQASLRAPYSREVRYLFLRLAV
jgi:hypothetical protein